MPGEPVAAATTLAIIAGASQFPRKPKLSQLAWGEPFAKSAHDFREYLQAEGGFALPGENLLDLFDSSKPPSQILEDIEEFVTSRQLELEARGGARDLLFYYVGHGAFLPSKEYFLAIRNTKEGSEGATGLRISDLANTIKNAAGTLRRYLIMDCCFAAAASKEFMGSPLELAHVQMREALPQTGTSLLCSSSAREISLAPSGETYTMFSGALLEILRKGVPRVSRSLSMALLGEEVRALIRRRYASDAVRPEVLSPDQHEDDLRDIPLFPNAALKPRIFDCTISLQDDRTVSIEHASPNGTLERVDGMIDGDPFTLLTIRRLNDWINVGVRLDQENIWKGNLSEPEDLKVIGASLFRVLFAEPRVRDAFMDLYRRFDVAFQAQKSATDSPDLRMRLRLTFHRKAGGIAQLPWEFLFIPSGTADATDGFFFAGARTELILTRYVPPSIRIGDARREPLRIMLAACIPTGDATLVTADALALKTAVRALQTQLQHVSKAVSLHENVSWRALSRALRTEKPHIFHFIGYGTFDQKGEKGGLALVGLSDDSEDRRYEDDEPRPVLPLVGDNLLNLFNYEPRPRLVFLHGCRTAFGNAAPNFRSQDALKNCARELALNKISAVVAMQYGMPHSELAAFATAAYSELAKGSGVDQAIRTGRTTLGERFLPNWADHPRFGAPIAYLQTDNPIVLPSEAGARADESDETRGLGPTGSAVSASTQRSAVAAPKSIAAAAAPVGDGGHARSDFSR